MTIAMEMALTTKSKLLYRSILNNILIPVKNDIKLEKFKQ